MPYTDKKREKFMVRIRRILKGNFPNFDNDNILIEDIKYLKKRIKEVKEELEQDIVYADSGLRLIRQVEKCQ